MPEKLKQPESPRQYLIWAAASVPLCTGTSLAFLYVVQGGPISRHYQTMVAATLGWLVALLFHYLLARRRARLKAAAEAGPAEGAE